MKTCPKCGKVIQNDNARFCKECGTDLFGKNDGGIWLGDPLKESTTPTPKFQKSETSVAKIGIFSVAVVALLLIVFYAFSGSDKQSEAKDRETELVEKPQNNQSQQELRNELQKKEAQNEQSQTPTTEKKVEQQPVTTKPAAAETEKTEDSQKKKLSAALAKGDYKQVQILANEGYAPAYVPLAKYYLNNNEYNDADRYANKAKAAGQSGAQAIIKTLENLGYYD